MSAQARNYLYEKVCVFDRKLVEFFFGPYFPVLSPNTGKYELEKSTYLDNFHTVKISADFLLHSLPLRVKSLSLTKPKNVVEFCST